MEIASSVKTPLSQTNVKSQKNRIFLLLSFGIPMLFLAVGLVLQNVHPFGDQQILVVDFWHQYYPFLRLLHEKLRSGGSLLYTWESGMGTNFLSIFAYYAASPLNLLTVLVPESILREAVTVVLLLKIGCAGLFFALFLRGTFHRDDFSICLLL
ncbi:MAG: YfhO family protein [Ruminococcus callidus]